MKVDQTMNPDMLHWLWRFVRGDTATEIFETWAYSEAQLESVLGAEAYLDLISVDYDDSRAVADLKARLSDRLPPPASCLCHTVPDRASVRLGEWSFSTLDVVEREVEGIAWLHRLHCTLCGTVWLVAAEELVYDAWLVSRQAGADWPEVKTYRGLLACVLSTGARVRYDDPLRSMELPEAMRALASETPGIALEEIVELLPIDRSVARQIALSVVAEHRVSINVER